MGRAGIAGCSLLLLLLTLRSQPLLLLPPRGRTALRAAPSPEAWREFRAQLIAQESQSEVRSVAPRNEELLRSQSEELWTEYMSGAWAHVALLEVGGLLCRSPLPAQLTWLMRQDANFIWAKKLKQLLLTELPEIEGRSREDLFQTWSQNTMFCYKLADRLALEGLNQIVPKAPQQLNDADKELIVLYGEMESTWQSVCLVLAVDASGARAVTINRPCARSMDARLAGLLLFGEAGAAEKEEQALLEKCLQAFGRESAVYFGGPHQLGKGLLVHGFDLEGAQEISPGTRIFTGGVEAAIDAVLEGTYSPLDFRWFIGCHQQLSTQNFGWVSVACARPVALKQCLGLPKPLWHEVMELCGSEHAELSRLELRKRDDVEDDEPNE